MVRMDFRSWLVARKFEHEHLLDRMRAEECDAILKKFDEFMDAERQEELEAEHHV